MFACHDLQQRRGHLPYLRWGRILAVDLVKRSIFLRGIHINMEFQAGAIACPESRNRIMYPQVWHRGQVGPFTLGQTKRVKLAKVSSVPVLPKFFLAVWRLERQTDDG